MEKTIMYLESTGKENTQLVIDASIKRAEELGIRQIVVSSTTGYTALEMTKAAKGKMLKIVCVSYQYGVKEDGKWEMSEMTELLQISVCIFLNIVATISVRLRGETLAFCLSDTWWFRFDTVSPSVRR